MSAFAVLPVSDFLVPAVSLELERTFWEKATILHAEFHRPASQTIRDRSARHFADMASLWQHPSRVKALTRLDLLQDVVRHKSRFFASAWASYDNAIPGTFHFVPPTHRHAELARDLEAMGPMLLQAPPSIPQLLRQLAEAEGQLNARTP
jgi:hypothetical protein